MTDKSKEKDRSPEEIEVREILDSSLKEIAQLKKIVDRIPADKGLAYDLRPPGSGILKFSNNLQLKEFYNKEISKEIDTAGEKVKEKSKLYSPAMQLKAQATYEHWKKPEIIERSILIIMEKGEEKSFYKSQDVAKAMLDDYRDPEIDLDKAD